MILNPQELSLNIESTYIPKTITEFLGEVSSICNVSEKLLKIDDFIKRLEDEMRKIDAFKRELPITVLLLSDVKDEVIKCKKTNVEPVLEEFIPLKRTCDEAEKNETKNENEKESRDKKNWMSSVQLWNHSDNQTSEFNHNPKQITAFETNKVFQKEFVQENVGRHVYAACESGKEGRTFKGNMAFPIVATKTEESPVARLSLFTSGTSSLSEGLGSSVLSPKTSSSRAVSFSSPNVQSNLRTAFQPLQQQSGRKQRRCWSQDLHRRFVNALQQLGGLQVATPKQIRELMQVDGLTNDEVKSHLQKYRLHTRKLPAAVTLNSATPGTLSLGAALWMPGNQYGESSKQSRSQSGSPQGPFQLTETTGGTSTTRTDSMDDDEDDNCESSGCKLRIQTSS